MVLVSLEAGKKLPMTVNKDHIPLTKVKEIRRQIRKEYFGQEESAL